MAKKISKIVQGKITPSMIQYDWIGAKEGEYLIIQDDEGKYGKFLSIYPPTKKEDKALVEEYAKKNNA